MAYAVNTYSVPAAFMVDLPFVLAIVKLPAFNQAGTKKLVVRYLGDEAELALLSLR